LISIKARQAPWRSLRRQTAKEAESMARIGMTAGLAGAMALGLLASACAPEPTVGRTAVSDGVKFDYVLAPAAAGSAPGAYHLTLALADAKSGAAISDATVAVSLYGPGIEAESNLVNLTHEAAGATSYAADVALPKAASYRLTFQVNRPLAPGAQAVFSTARPTSAG
jgi:hypothetical protein